MTGYFNAAVKRIILAFSSACLLVLSFPDFNYSMCAWVGLVPLFLAVDKERARSAFGTSFLSGVLFFLGTVYWLVHVTLPGMLAVVAYLAVYFGLFGMFASAALSMDRKGEECSNLQLCIPLFSIPAFWVILEWIRAHALTGFGWVLIGHSQAPNLTIIQIADITGAYGVSFLVVLVNVAIFLTVRGMRRKEYKIACLAVALTLVFLVTAYGIVKMKKVFVGEKVKVAVVQGNIPQTKKWDQAYRKEIVRKYERLTEAAAGEKPDLIIWPETSVPGFVEFEEDLYVGVSALARKVDIPVLVGTPSADKYATDVLYNSAVLFGRDGKIAGHYNKLHLVPFGEYVPFKRVLSFVERFAPSPIGDFRGGEEMFVLGFFIERRTATKDATTRFLKKARFSCLICFEDIFPELARQAIRNGASFLVNMTNDAWFKYSSAPYQHAQNSVFRAIENRAYVVRAANTGYSCFIDQKGEIVDAVGVPGNNIFVDGYRSHDVTLSRVRTFYNIYGDMFVFICVCIVGSYLVYILSIRRRE